MKNGWTGRYAGYSIAGLRKDLVSGIIVGIIAIPLGMAFAIASGVKPEYGIYTTIVAGILISLLGGSRFQIGGPTGAFIPILFGIVMEYGYANLLIAGFMAGVMLLLMGLLRLGGLMRFIPRPVIVGFTAGIAVTIFTSQIAGFLGLEGVRRHEYFLENMMELWSRLGTLNLYALLVAVVSLLCMIGGPRIAPRLPASLVALTVSTVVAVLFMEGKVATIGSVYGNIPGTLPVLHIPVIGWEQLVHLWKPALLIAMLGAMESLLSAVVADSMSGDRHNSNRELIGQGVANMVTPLFGGIPATGAIARTAANIRSGAVSPMSGVIHGLTVLLVLLLLAPYASAVPLAGMAPVLMIVAWNMSERKEFIRLVRVKTGDSLVLIITFLLTIFTDLTTAVEVGLLLAVLLFVKRMSQTMAVKKVLPDPSDKHAKVMPHMVYEGHDCPQVQLYTVEGALFFGAAAVFERELRETLREQPKALVLLMHKVPVIDSTGEGNLEELWRHVKYQGGRLLLVGLQEQPAEVLKGSGLLEELGVRSIYEHTGDAIDYALGLVDTGRCRGCSQLAFRECRELAADAGSAEWLPAKRTGAAWRVRPQE